GNLRPVLAPEQSASLRQHLVTQLAVIHSTDDAAAWAHRNLAAKNTLTAADAQIVEERFQARVATINDGLSPSQSNAVPVQSVMPGGRADASASQKILTESGKTPLKEAVSPLAKTVRLRDKEHRKFVSRQPCLVCGGHRRTLMIFGLSSLMRCGPASVTNSQSRCVASITVIFTARVTRRPGGLSSPSILYRSRSNYGSSRGSMALQPQRKHPSKAQAGTVIDPDIDARKLSTAAHAMTSFRQIEANRRNALRSTGPKTEAGKRRGNAFLHGLTAETVVAPLDDI